MSTRIRRSGLLRGAAVAATASAVLAAGLTGLTEPDGTANTGTAAAARPASGPAATEEAAKEAARESGKRVEVLGLRGERRDVFAEPDGTFTAREYTEPVRTVRDGAWVGIDATLVRRADGTVVPKATTVDLAFSSGEAGKPFATLRRAGREFALTWPYGKLPAPVLEGDTATYADALPGVDLTVRAETDGFAHLLVVKTPEAAADPRLARIDLGLRTKGLKLTKDASGALKAEDAAVGGTVFQAGRPSMWDSASVEEAAAKPQGAKAVARALTADGAPAPAPALEGPGGGGRTAPLGIEIGKGRLGLVPDRALLTGPDTVFPVVIDPIQRTTSRSAWTGVMSGMPTEQDWKYSDSAGVGRCPTDYNPVSCNGVGVRRVMFTVPMSFYKGKQILGATFSARVAHIYQAQPTAVPIQLHRIGGANHTITSSSNWSNTSTQWTDHLQTVSKAISPTSCSSQANLHFESGSTGGLTNQVRTAANGGWSSMSLGLRAEDEGTFSQWKRVCGNAYLSVSYNTLPSQITAAMMSSNPGGGCKTGTARPYAEEPPKLYTEARDPDHANGLTDKVKVQFKVEWVDGAGAAQSYTADTAYLAPVAGTKFWHQVKSTIPQNRTISWSVRAFDGDGWGPWSAAKCEFVYDATLPGKPNVLSEQYPAGTVYHDGVGTYGTFTFSPNRNDSIPDTDVVKYRYAFDSTASPATTVAASAPGGPASVRWMPTRPGPHWLEVVAVDKAENPGTVHRYEFNVSEGRAAAAQWSLADAAGSTEAHDEQEKFSASAGGGVTFGVEGPGGKVDSAARLDGSADAYLDAGQTVLDTAGGFSVSAWVRPTDLSRDMTVVSQDGTGEPGFTLGYNAVAKTWAFSVPRTDVQTIGEWRAAATGLAVVKDQWVLLTGVYDAQQAQLQLYVNQTLKGSSPRLSPWRAYGPLQIGRSTAKTGYRDNFAGDLAEVRVFDRVLPAAQVAELMTVKPARKGYWQLDTATDGASPETGGGSPLQLNGDAHVYRPADPVFDEAALVGDGHLVLDGDGDYAATATPPVTGGRSFTVTARAQLTSIDSTAAQTVLSLPGAHANRVAVRYRPGTETEPPVWELAVARSDAATAEVHVFKDAEHIPDNEGAGQHLAVVYDAFANEIRLYVNGQLTGAADRADDTLWPATRGLQVGRSLVGDSEYFAGSIDEVRVYDGAADTTAIQKMALLAPLTDI
ncbi:LamG domain-containing protein [Streptomyces sp. TRM76323]|uniref:LamG domain-containing protein n=1 Tax=Streptomyces tamarix TaxID=3078565 RepID=A0ABU3QJM9_9ACTN|nr:LamG domain-containing protein [Streptomyces tamarix]MDT9682973.1 LamG domain-containing protein [Streptomyces tamarix]